ncbi:hypothetical protein FRC01_013356, partial [Tulasnella sp. 417]
MIQRIAPFLTPVAVLFSLGMSPLSGLELAYMYFAAATLLDSAFLLEWAIVLVALLWKLTMLTRYYKAKTGGSFVVLILIHYKGWTTNPNKGRPMQLDSVKGDMKRLLDCLQYRHDDTTRTWYILSDFEFMYEDFTGKKQPLARCGLPDRDTILKKVEEATRNGGSVLIH